MTIISLNICYTAIWVYLYHTHKTLGPISERSCDTNFPLLCWTEAASRPVCLYTLKKDENQTRRGWGIQWMFENINLITECWSQSDTCCNGSSIGLVLLTMYTSISRNKIFTMLPENPTENFPAYCDSLDCVIKKKKIGNLTYLTTCR